MFPKGGSVVDMTNLAQASNIKDSDGLVFVKFKIEKIKLFCYISNCAQVLESVDNQDLKSCGASRVGSSPTLGTNKRTAEEYPAVFNF